ncbi:hypothetical protein Tco_0127211 [Tanacetum coccineum]
MKMVSYEALCVLVNEEMYICENRINFKVVIFLWKGERLHLLAGSPGPSTPPTSSPGPSTLLSYSLGPFRYAPSLRNAECSNGKFLTKDIKVLARKIRVLKATLEMEMHPEYHTLDLTVVLHELYNDMGKLGLK